MNELKPCPFCGGEAETLTAESMHGGYLFGIMCNDCRSRGDIYDTEAEAVAAWNTRSDDYKQAAEYWQRMYEEYWQRMYEESFTERTCRNESEPPTGFLCSTCGWGDFNEPTHLLTGAKYTGQIHGGPNYCPNCGAKVVSE